MKLRVIAEVRLKHSKTVIRDAAEAFGDLMQFIYSLGQTDEGNALEAFLKKPNARSWDTTKWIIDAATQKASGTRNLQDRMQKWAGLKTLTSPVITAALYDIDPKFTKGTPLQQLSLSRQMRDKFKLAMGPQGYVSTLANTDGIPHNRLKEMLRSTAKSGVALAKAGKEDVPGVKPIARF